MRDVTTEASPDLNLTPLAVFFLVFAERSDRGPDRNLPLGVRWVRHKNVSHPNHSMSATILSMCYALTESLGVSELNDTNIKSFGVPGRISRAVQSTNFTTIVFTLPHIDHGANYRQATGLDAWASRVKCPARFVSHLHDICIYMSCL